MTRSFSSTQAIGPVTNSPVVIWFFSVPSASNR